MFYLYFHILLKIVLYLVILYFQIQNNYEFCQNLVWFFKHVIRSFVFSDFHSKTLYHLCFDVNNPMTISKFVILLKQDSKFPICKD